MTRSNTAEYFDVKPFQDRVLFLHHQNGIALHVLADRCGFTGSSQLKRAVGLMSWANSKARDRKEYTTTEVKATRALQLARGLDMDPVELGL